MHTIPHLKRCLGLQSSTERDVAALTVQVDVSRSTKIETILVVASDPQRGSNLSGVLRSVGYKTDVASGTPTQVDDRLAAMQLMIFFNSTPHWQIETLCEICSTVRRKAPNLPVIVLGPNDTESKVRLFELGADDYLVEPFDRRELLARISSLIRRQNQYSR
jgi:DNA-binding response OmpR family regulator